VSWLPVWPVWLLLPVPLPPLMPQVDLPMPALVPTSDFPVVPRILLPIPNG